MNALLSLLHLCDSLFPLGSFAHSDGLEAATAAGQVSSREDLEAWMAATLDENLGRCEGPAVTLAWRGLTSARLEDLLALDSEVHALRPSASVRQASRAMGTRLLRTWRLLHPELQVGLWNSLPGHSFTLPVAFGCVGAASAIEQRQTVEAFCYTRLAAAVSSAMRLMPIGQHEAHAVLSQSLDQVAGVVEAMVERDRRPAAFMPALDLAAMSHQYVHSRLFRS